MLAIFLNDYKGFKKSDVVEVLEVSDQPFLKVVTTKTDSTHDQATIKDIKSGKRSLVPANQMIIDDDPKWQKELKRLADLQKSGQVEKFINQNT